MEFNSSNDSFCVVHTRVYIFLLLLRLVKQVKRNEAVTRIENSFRVYNEEEEEVVVFSPVSKLKKKKKKELNQIFDELREFFFFIFQSSAHTSFIDIALMIFN